MIMETRNPITESLEETGSIRATILQNSWKKRMNAIGYLLAMGICGLVLVALGSLLNDLAENVGMSSIQIASVFLCRGGGAVSGALISSRIYSKFNGNRIIIVAIFWITFFLIILPFVKRYWVLNVVFFCLGFGTALTDTGCQIMTRKLHGKKAGPWLGANTVSFSVFGILVPIIELLTEQLLPQLAVISIVSFVIGMYLCTCPDPTENQLFAPPPIRTLQDRSVKIHYHAEIVISGMVFCFVGGNVTMTAYLKTYCSDTHILNNIASTYIVLVLWAGVAVGRIFGVLDQKFLNHKILQIHFVLVCFFGAIVVVFAIIFPFSIQAFSVGVAFYGFFHGPSVGYSYDWNNRITFPSELSMSIVMFGLNFGASIVPFLTAELWNNGIVGPEILLYVVLLSVLVPIPLLPLSKALSYAPHGISEIRNESVDTVMSSSSIFSTAHFPMLMFAKRKQNNTKFNEHVFGVKVMDDGESIS